jgi:hypothetical protein
MALVAPVVGMAMVEEVETAAVAIPMEAATVAVGKVARPIRFLSPRGISQLRRTGLAASDLVSFLAHRSTREAAGGAVPQVTGRSRYMDRGRMGTTVALEVWERRSMELMQPARRMMRVTTKRDFLRDRISKVVTLNCRLVIKIFAMQ